MRVGDDIVDKMLTVAGTNIEQDLAPTLEGIEIDPIQDLAPTLEGIEIDPIQDLAPTLEGIEIDPIQEIAGIDTEDTEDKKNFLFLLLYIFFIFSFWKNLNGALMHSVHPI